MSPRIIIAAQSGVVIGLIGLTLYQGRQLREAHRELGAAALPAPELPAGTNQRPVRLRLQQLPPINIRTQVRELDWRTVESDDYATYVANLRRIGCPEETIRDILVADIRKVYGARRRALQSGLQGDWQFWRHPDDEETDASSNRTADLERELALHALDQEQRQLVASLLGEFAVRAEFAELKDEALQDRSLQFLAPAKREAVAEAFAKLQQARRDILMREEEERDALQAAAEADFQKALQSALLPEERREYELRTSPIAAELREQLRGFEASREEFEQLFDLTRQLAAVDQEDAAPGGPSLEERREAARLELEQKIKETLGPTRYADYQRSQDADYQTLYSLARDHEVPPSVANDVWDMRRTVEQQTDRIRANPLLTVEQKVRALEAIRDETKAAIVDVLGQPLLEDYARQGGGWLIDLTAPENLGESGVPVVPPPLPETVPGPSPQQALAVPYP